MLMSMDQSCRIFIKTPGNWIYYHLTGPGYLSRLTCATPDCKLSVPGDRDQILLRAQWIIKAVERSRGLVHAATMLHTALEMKAPITAHKELPEKEGSSVPSEYMQNVEEGVDRKRLEAG
ncbi:Gator Complex Protein Wdr24 [Manis pentadactyla]|nr:Gator Complex Protein Wdr24 [Manis pentadactyla]